MTPFDKKSGTVICLDCDEFVLPYNQTSTLGDCKVKKQKRNKYATANDCVSFKPKSTPKR